MLVHVRNTICQINVMQVAGPIASYADSRATLQCTLAWRQISRVQTRDRLIERHANFIVL